MPARMLTAAFCLTLVGVAACKDKAAIARSDTLQGQLTEQQRLANQLAAQKDSLTRVVLDADAFIGSMDSAITTVKGLPRSKRKASDPLADQVQARKDMHERVTALVSRAKATANQLAELQKKQSETEAANTELRQKNEAQAAKIEEDAQMVVDLGTTIERQKNH